MNSASNGTSGASFFHTRSTSRRTASGSAVVADDEAASRCRCRWNIIGSTGSRTERKRESCDDADDRHRQHADIRRDSWSTLTCLPIASAGVAKPICFAASSLTTTLTPRCGQGALAAVVASSGSIGHGPLSLANCRDSLRPASSLMPIVSKKAGIDAVPADGDRLGPARHQDRRC